MRDLLINALLGTADGHEKKHFWRESAVGCIPLLGALVDLYFCGCLGWNDPNLNGHDGFITRRAAQI